MRKQKHIKPIRWPPYPNSASLPIPFIVCVCVPDKVCEEGGKKTKTK